MSGSPRHQAVHPSPSNKQNGVHYVASRSKAGGILSKDMEYTDSYDAGGSSFAASAQTVVPPCDVRKSIPSIMSKKTSASVKPGRLFLRTTTTTDNNTFALGPFSIYIEQTKIDTGVVDAVRKKLEERKEKEAKAAEKKASKAAEKANKSGNNEANEETIAQEILKRPKPTADSAPMGENPKLPSLQITHSSKQTPLWSSPPGVNFVGGACVSLISTPTLLQEHTSKSYGLQTIDSIERGPANVVTIRGQLGCSIVDGRLSCMTVEEAAKAAAAKAKYKVDGGEREEEVEERGVHYELAFILDDEISKASVEAEGNGIRTEGKVLSFQLRIVTSQAERPTEESTKSTLAKAKTTRKKNPANTFEQTPNQAHLLFSTTSDEAFFGFGHRLSQANAKGTEVSVFHRDMNSATDGYSAKKSQLSTKSTVPQFISSNGRCVYLHNSHPSTFDFTLQDVFTVRVQCNTISGKIISATAPLEAIQMYTALNGRSKPLPSWTQRGIILGLQGGTSTVRDTTLHLKRRHCPIAGVLIHDWTGVQSNTNKIWYNWILEREHYKNYHKLVDELESRGINVGLYVNNVVEECPVHLRSGRRYLFGEAESGDYLVKKNYGKKQQIGQQKGQDKIYPMGKKGNPKAGVLDLTNFKACDWYKSVIQGEVLDYAGASFWMADLREGAPVAKDASYRQQGIDGMSLHNSYADEWSKVNREVIRDAGREGDSFFIVPSGYGSTPKYAGCTSLGDHMTNMKKKDGGLQAILNGIVNGGFSGFTYGHCAVSFAVPRTINSLNNRAKEMMCRWMEMQAFTVLFRTHDCNDGKSSVCGYDDVFLLKALTRWSNVFSALAEYRSTLSNEAAFWGYPVVRHPLLHFPEDEMFMGCNVSSFMLGGNIYVAPVMKYGVVKTKVYLPEGKWMHLWVSTDILVVSCITFDLSSSLTLGIPLNLKTHRLELSSLNPRIAAWRLKSLLP